MYEWDDTLKMTPHSYTEEKPADLPKNYWGYSEKNFYFAPKQSYSSTPDSCRELKDLIREMHARKMECIPEFFFPQGTNPMLALEAVHFWVDSYHADGFHFVGAGVPTELLIRDPYLTRTKMLFENIDADWIYGGHNPVRRNLMEYNDSFMMNGRAFLKGDEGQLGSFADHVRRNRTTHEFVNYMANVNGFTLADAVSYDWKHNEKNGEDNEDGPAVNASWNCGAEGRTKKASVLALRRKQEENALSYVFLSQGVPLLYAGDEFGNSQGGNNNAYSSNNSVGWLDWNEIGKEKDLTLFVKKLIAFRKNHPILHMIFSIVCEELGVFGGIILILLFVYLLYRLFFIARNANDLYGSLMVTGIFAHIALQVILNICVVLNLIPTTGITLPFVSYGGTSVLFLMMEMSIALSVSRGIRFQKEERDLWGSVVEEEY